MLRRGQNTLMTVSAVLLAIAPKCPICFLAYFGIFGVATASVSAYRAWLPLITAVWLALTVATLAFQRRGRRRYGPALLGLLAALTIFVGRFSLNDQAFVYSGISALVVAVVWRTWLQKPTANESCSGCELSLLNEDKRKDERAAELPNFGSE